MCRKIWHLKKKLVQVFVNHGRTSASGTSTHENCPISETRPGKRIEKNIKIDVFGQPWKTTNRQIFLIISNRFFFVTIFCTKKRIIRALNGALLSFALALDTFPPEPMTFTPVHYGINHRTPAFIKKNKKQLAKLNTKETKAGLYIIQVLFLIKKMNGNNPSQDRCVHSKPHTKRKRSFGNGNHIVCRRGGG